MVPTRSRGVMGEGLDVCDTRLMPPFMAACLALVSDASGHPPNLRTGLVPRWPPTSVTITGMPVSRWDPSRARSSHVCYHSCYHVPSKWGHPGATGSYQERCDWLWGKCGIPWIHGVFQSLWPIVYGEECMPIHGAARKIVILGIPCDFMRFLRGLAVSGVWLRPGVLPWPRRGPIS